MNNNIHNLSKIPSMPERVLSALAYLTCGFAGLILFVIATINKTNLKSFVKFNIFQSILIGLILAVVQFSFQILVELLQFLNIIPVIGTIINSFLHFILYFVMGFPILFNCSFLALVLYGLIIYLTTMSLMGKTPYIPIVSPAIKRTI